MYTVKETAKILQVSEETVRRWIRSGKVEACKSANKSGYKIPDACIHKLLPLRDQPTTKSGSENVRLALALLYKRKLELEHMVRNIDDIIHILEGTES